MRRLVLLCTAVVSVGLAAPSFAAAPPIPVSVHENPDGSVCIAVSLQVPYCTPPVSVHVPKGPIVPITVTRAPNGGYCVTVSKQVPQCTPGTD